MLGSGRAADKRVTNHDGWEFNGVLRTPHLESDNTHAHAHTRHDTTQPSEVELRAQSSEEEEGRAV